MTNNIELQVSASRSLGTLLVVCVALFFGVLNASAVGVALPLIASDLSIGPGKLTWLMTSFLLIYGVAIPVYGRLSDIYGARRLFLLGVTVFSVGSTLAAFAPSFEWLLASRVVQAVGGAAVPGLGMTLVSRAYPVAVRGKILGVVAATIGVGGAIGPLMGGLLSQSFGWPAIFAVNSAAAATIPVAYLLLPRAEDRAGGTLDTLGALALGLLVAGVLLFASEGARAGWNAPLALVGAGAGAIGLLALVARQLTAESPFIPREFLGNYRFLALTAMSFSVMAVSLATLIGLPLLLTTVHRLSSLEVGLALLPNAILASGLGWLAGRVTDQKGARLPARVGGPIMLVAVVGLSTFAGSTPWVIALFAGLLGGGFGLINTPLASTISRLVRVQVLASALSINSMLFFLGGSVGTALLVATVARSSVIGSAALNPLHLGGGAGFSNAFLLLTLPAVAVLILSLFLPRAEPVGAAIPAGVTEPEGEAESPRWVHDCSLPWAPACQEASAAEYCSPELAARPAS